MKPHLLLYGTFTGNTFDAATHLFGVLSKDFPNQQFELRSVREITPEKLASYNKIIFGTSTWDDAPNPETKEFMEELTKSNTDLSKSSVAVFMLGDTRYQDFCAALPQVKNQLGSLGAQLHHTDFTIDGIPTTDMFQQLTDWAKKFVI